MRPLYIFLISSVVIMLVALATAHLFDLRPISAEMIAILALVNVYDHVETQKKGERK